MADKINPVALKISIEIVDIIFTETLVKHFENDPGVESILVDAAPAAAEFMARRLQDSFRHLVAGGAMGSLVS